MKNKPLTLKFLLQSPWHFLALGFGTGLAPKAPGTFGTLAGIPFVYAMTLLSSSVQLIVLLVCALVGIYICGITAKNAGVHDHGAIVWDEIVGLMITMLFMPFTVLHLVVGFVLFRVFDILKPWPISLADQKLTGGFGIMFDDILAGLLALAVMQLIF